MPEDESTKLKLAWVTDAHLDFLHGGEVEAFFDTLVAAAPDALLLGGDTARADSLEAKLRDLEGKSRFPVYFVLGNHDYYYGSINDMRDRMRAITHETARLRWLQEAGFVKLTDHTGLVGCDGWGDGRLGDYGNSNVKLNDIVYIEDLAALSEHNLHEKMKELGRDAAAHLEHVLPLALRSCQHLLVLTHVPPFTQACRHEGRPAGPDWLPFFACGAVGDVLLEAAMANPFHHFTVFAGHTHSPCDTHVLPNLQIRTAHVEYGKPRISATLEVN